MGSRRCRPSGGERWRGRAVSFGGHGDVGGEGGPATLGALHRQPAAMTVDDVLYDGEAQAGSGVLPALLTLHAIEPLRQARQIRAAAATALIFHPHGRVTALDGETVRP